MFGVEWLEKLRNHIVEHGSLSPTEQLELVASHLEANKVMLAAEERCYGGGAPRLAADAPSGVRPR